MATITPGPLASQIHGSIGGTTFSERGAKTVLRSHTKPTSKASSALTVSRNLIAGAGSKWAALSPSQRDAWSDLAARLLFRSGSHALSHYSPFALFCAALAAQSGRSAPTTPANPQAYVPCPPCAPTLTAAADGLWVTALSRILSTGEQLLVRALRSFPAHITRPLYKLAGFVELAAGGWFTPTPELAITLPSAAYVPYRASFFTASNHNSFEFWIRMDPSPPVTAMYLYYGADTYKYLRYTAGLWQIMDNLTLVTLGTYALTPGRWYYVAALHNGTASTVSLYIDGALKFGPKALACGGLNAFFYVGGATAGVARWQGAMDEFRFSTVVRSPTEIAANWNNGIGRVMPLDADTLALWHFDSYTGTTTFDSTTHHLDLTSASHTLTFGPGPRLLYPIAQLTVPLPCSVATLSTPGQGNLFLAAPTYTVHPWV